MERFYLDNVARYHSLVERLDPLPKPRVSTGITGPNMLVGARIKPLSPEESFPSAIFRRSAEPNVVDVHDLYNHPKGLPTLKSFNYQLDRIFGPDATTDEIFEDIVADLIPFVWNGGTGTLFAYGQTGSGKTFTISRMSQLVAEALTAGTLAGDRDISMTIIDLAGNSAFDLLNNRHPISLLEDSHGVTQMVGVTEHQIHTRDQMSELVERATSFRRTAPTLRNDASSRSHAIYRLRITNLATETHGLFYLIDLAGSEAARDVAAHGADRMRETREINNSLSALKDCIRGKAEADALSSSSSGTRTATGAAKPPHIPFRRSALTKVLKHVFDAGGRSSAQEACKTVVIACVNPSIADVGPSKNTLRFAELLRVVIPLPPNPNLPSHWTNAQLKTWIKENAGNPPILPNVLAPRESGAQFFAMSSTELEYRCRKCPGVKLHHAKAFLAELWRVQIEAQKEMERWHWRGTSKADISVSGT